MTSILSTNKSVQSFSYNVSIPNFDWALNTISGSRVSYTTTNQATFKWLTLTMTTNNIISNNTYIINNTPLSGAGSGNSPTNWNNVPVRTVCFLVNQAREFYQDISINEIGTYQVSYWISLNINTVNYTGTNTHVMTVYIDNTVVIPSYSIPSGNANWVNLTGTYTETSPGTRRLKVSCLFASGADPNVDTRINWTYVTIRK